MSLFSQRPTLGEFIRGARSHGWVIRRLKPLGGQFGKERLKYRLRKNDRKIVDLPLQNEDERLSQTSFEVLCQNTGIPEEDFRNTGGTPDLFDS